MSDDMDMRIINEPPMLLHWTAKKNGLTDAETEALWAGLVFAAGCSGLRPGSRGRDRLLSAGLMGALSAAAAAKSGGGLWLSGMMAGFALAGETPLAMAERV